MFHAVGVKGRKTPIGRFSNFMPLRVAAPKRTGRGPLRNLHDQRKYPLDTSVRGTRPRGLRQTAVFTELLRNSSRPFGRKRKPFSGADTVTLSPAVSPIKNVRFSITISMNERTVVPYLIKPNVRFTKPAIHKGAASEPGGSRSETPLCSRPRRT